MNAKQKYLKDENGQTFSPITSVNSIYGENGQTLLNLFYPIGSYYETSNGKFNPNESWGGTWRRDTNGYVTVGCQDPDEGGITSADNDRLLINNGATQGEVNHILTVSEMPSHNHLTSNDAPTVVADLANWQNIGEGGVHVGRSNFWNGTSSTGGGKSHNNIQPSIGVYRWHRTA